MDAMKQTNMTAVVRDPPVLKNWCDTYCIEYWQEYGFSRQAYQQTSVLLS